MKSRDPNYRGRWDVACLELGIDRVPRQTILNVLWEDEEEVEGTVDFDGGEEVNYVPFVYPRGTVSVSSLGSF